LTPLPLILHSLFSASKVVYSKSPWLLKCAPEDARLARFSLPNRGKREAVHVGQSPYVFATQPDSHERSEELAAAVSPSVTHAVSLLSDIEANHSSVSLHRQGKRTKAFTPIL
jgi:hypothetical protein